MKGQTWLKEKKEKKRKKEKKNPQLYAFISISWSIVDEGGNHTVGYYIFTHVQTQPLKWSGAYLPVFASISLDFYSGSVLICSYTLYV